MSLFDKRMELFGPKEITVGEVDYSVDGFYRNVVTIPLDVKPKHMLHVKLKSDKPVDIVVASDNYEAIFHKNGVTDLEAGPFPTEKRDSMGLIIAVFRGDLAHVTLEAWIEKR